MKYFCEIMFLFTLIFFGYAFSMESLQNTIQNENPFENYLSNIHNQIRWSIYNNEPYKALDGFYKWDESIGIFKGIPCFKEHFFVYKRFLQDRETEIQSIMAHNQILKQYFLMLTDQERSLMRQKGFEWAQTHFPHAYFIPKKQKQNLITKIKAIMHLKK